MRFKLFAPMAVLVFALSAVTPVGSGLEPASKTTASATPELVMAERISSIKVLLEPQTGGVIEVSMREVLSKAPASSTLRFPLLDGQSLTFAMPEQVETLYTVRRIANRVEVSSRDIEFLELASAD